MHRRHSRKQAADLYHAGPVSLFMPTSTRQNPPEGEGAEARMSKSAHITHGGSGSSSYLWWYLSIGEGFTDAFPAPTFEQFDFIRSDEGRSRSVREAARDGSEGH